jgi:tetratricopeptide (TPR) repeat protein
MKPLCLVFSLFLATSVVQIAQAQVTPSTTPPSQKTELAMPDLMLDVQNEFARISEVRADERIKLLQAFIKKATPLTTPAYEALLKARAAWAETMLKQQRIEPAIEQFQIAIDEFPKPTNDRIFSIMLAFPLTVFNHGYRKEAIELMSKFEAISSEQHNRLAQIATFYLNAEDGQDALRVLNRAVELDPKIARYHYGLASAYLIQLQPKEAKAEFQKTINLDPKHPLAFASLAAIYRSEKSLEDAIALYKKQIEVTPETEVAHGGLAICYLLNNQNDLAKEELAKQFAIAPRDFLLFTQLGYLAASRQDYRHAHDWAELALGMAPGYAWARIVLANTLIQQQDFSGAEEILSDIVARGTRFPTLYFEITKALLLAENYDGAFEQIDQYLKITPEAEFELQIGLAPKRAVSLKTLLEKEHQAALALPTSLTSDQEYRLVENFLRFQFYISKLKLGTTQQEVLGRRQRAEIQVKVLEYLAPFLSVNDGRQAFRKMWAVEQLLNTDIALERAAELSNELVKEAETATRPENSIREAPELDFAKRQKLFRARAYHLLGQIRLKQGQLEESIKALKLAIDNFTDSPEQRVAISHLATVTQAAGNDKEALSLYIKSYNKYDDNATVQKVMIENLYRKIHGSLEGLDLK